MLHPWHTGEMRWWLVGPESLKSLAASQWKRAEPCPVPRCAGPFAKGPALCSFLSCRAEKTEVLSEDLLQVRSSAADLTHAQGARGCPGTHPWGLDAAAALCWLVPRCPVAVRQAGRSRRGLGMWEASLSPSRVPPQPFPSLVFRSAGIGSSPISARMAT